MAVEPRVVEPNSRFSDWALSRKVRMALFRNPETRDYANSIVVRTSNGVVHLVGRVPSRRVKNTCERVALSVPQVWTMVNDIKVVH